MKNLQEVLDQKEKEFRKLEREVYALRISREILMEEEDLTKGSQVPQPPSEGLPTPAKQEKRWP